MRKKKFVLKEVTGGFLPLAQPKGHGQIDFDLYEYYQAKAATKPKMVALGAVMHKISNYIFAVLRDEAEFSLRSPEDHRQAYKTTDLLAA